MNAGDKVRIKASDKVYRLSSLDPSDKSWWLCDPDDEYEVYLADVPEENLEIVKGD